MPHIFNYKLLNVELALLPGNSLIKCMDFVHLLLACSKYYGLLTNTIAMNFAQKHYLKTFFCNRKQNFETFGGCHYSGVTNIRMVPLSQKTNAC